MVGIAGKPGYDKGQNGRFQKIDKNVLTVGKFGQDIPLTKDPELLQ